MLEALLQPYPCEKHSGELRGTGKARDLQQKKNLTSRCRHSLYLPWMLEKTCYAREPGRAVWQLLPGPLLCHLSQDHESLEETAL